MRKLPGVRGTLFVVVAMVCSSTLQAYPATPTHTVAAEHLASPDLIEGALTDAAAQRDRDLAVLGGLLADPVAERAATMMGVQLRTVQAAVATLSDSELRDLSARADALNQDPVAGLSDKDRRLIIIVAVIVFVVPMLLLLTV